MALGQPTRRPPGADERWQGEGRNSLMAASFNEVDVASRMLTEWAELSERLGESTPRTDYILAAVPASHPARLSVHERGAPLSHTIFSLMVSKDTEKERSYRRTRAWWAST